MMPSTGLLPGHIVVHHDTDALGSVMGWGEWDGAPMEDLAATHIEFGLNGLTIAKMNPAVSSTYPAIQAPWHTCSVLAFKPLLVPDGRTVNVHTDPLFAANLAAETAKHLGEPYDWDQIKDFTWQGFLARFDPKAALTDEARAYVLNAAAGHFGVCSEWAEARLEAVILATYGMTVNLFEGTGVGHDHARPSDWQRSGLLYTLAGQG